MSRVTKNDMGISIHALQTECDSERSNIIHDYHISIHALQAECDTGKLFTETLYPNFYPRTPSGVRLHQLAFAIIDTIFLSTHSKRSATGTLLPRTATPFVFLSTHSKRSATVFGSRVPFSHCISIHALQAECDGKGRPIKI